MNHSFVAQKGKSILRVEYVSESWGEIKNVEIRTEGETPNLTYDFETRAVSMSSGDFTAELPALVSVCRRVAGAICHYNDIVTIFTNEGWEVISEK